MKYYITPSFERKFKKQVPQKQDEIKRTVKDLTFFFESGIRSEGLGLKHMKKDFWEIRSSLKDRVLFTFQKGTISFVTFGNHDDIKKYLKNI